MDFRNGHMRPGKVVDVLAGGVIKASVPGLFSGSDAADDLPPIHPFPFDGCNAFSTVEKDDEVWVMFFDNNPLELFWMRKDNGNGYYDDYLNDNKYVDILCLRRTPTSKAILLFSEGDGWLLKFKDSLLRINPKGEILLTNGSGHRSITINDDNVGIGGTTEPAVLGDKLVDCLNKLNKVLMLIEVTAKSSPYTIPISEAMSDAREAFADAINPIKSDNVRLD